jgi:broad specificity phosphatase PhoE
LGYVYLIRHGQAGSRENYDLLSELGREQARLLGRHLVEHGIEFSAIYSGDMCRQRQTAETTGELLAEAGLAPKEIISDRGWNEFSLISVYRAIAGRMRAESEEFARDFEEMQRVIMNDPHATGGATGRCDAAVVRAWIENRYPDYEGESWIDFKSRIHEAAKSIRHDDPQKAIAVFTSATPVAINAAAALGLPDEKLLNILGVIYNSSLTIIRVRNGDSRLLSFNATPHLAPARLTFR